MSIRVAAVGDLHMRPAVRGNFRPAFVGLEGKADLLLLAGDLTNGGKQDETYLLCEEVADLPLPTIAVLGNHDHDEGYGAEMAERLTNVGVQVLDGDHVTVDVDGKRVGVAGVMGGGGGFPGYPDVNTQPEHVARMRRGPIDAERLREALKDLDSDVRIALMHFAPITATLEGEPTVIYPGLGCAELADAVDSAGAHLVVHGHAHAGSERGRTPGGVPVRNVAHPVLRRTYAIYLAENGEAGE